MGYLEYIHNPLPTTPLPGGGRACRPKGNEKRKKGEKGKKRDKREKGKRTIGKREKEEKIVNIYAIRHLHNTFPISL